MANQTQAEWEQAMALRAMELTRSALYLDLRYLNAALGALRLTHTQSSHRGLATDGERLIYAPAWVLELYRKNRAYLPRAYLHSVLHCVFRHPWLRAGRDPAVWGLSCDIAVEYTLDTLQTPSLRRPVGWLRQQTYAELGKAGRFLAAGPIYRALCGWEPARLQKLQGEFYCDSHHLWPADENAPAARAQAARWEQLGRQTQLELQQAGRQAGENAGATSLSIQVRAGQSRRAYRDFLRKFAVWREEPKLDPDEFDLGYYTYGLRTYGNLPLIEPLESREEKRIRDFAIVVDTSESTAGALVKAFLRETFTLLKSTESFFTHCRILVLQCDDAVREEQWLTTPEEFDRYAARFTLAGGGGTDFRPAFARLAQLQAEGVFTDLRGVLYFTDGKGVFPSRRPPFDAAFLFLDNGTEPPPVPPWAMRLVLQPEEFLLPAPPPDWAFTELSELPEL